MYQNGYTNWSLQHQARGIWLWRCIATNFSEEVDIFHQANIFITLT